MYQRRTPAKNTSRKIHSKRELNRISHLKVPAKYSLSTLDLQEGRSAEKFQALYGMMPRVRSPKIYWGTTSRRVLTMEWIEGVKLTNKEAMDVSGCRLECCIPACTAVSACAAVMAWLCMCCVQDFAISSNPKILQVSVRSYCRGMTPQRF